MSMVSFVHQNVKRIVIEESVTCCTQPVSGRSRSAGGDQDPRWPDLAMPLNDP